MTNAVKIDRTVGFGLAGMLHLLTRRLHQNAQGALGILTDEELMTLSNQVDNVRRGALEGLETLGNLISSHNPEVGNLNGNSIGWLILHLVEELGEMLEMECTVERTLLIRGIDPVLGTRLLPQKAVA